MGAKFLCCLPLRMGVLVISFLQFIITGALAGFSWWIFYDVETKDLPEVTSSLRTAIIVAGAIYTVTAIISLLGFLGALLKKLTFIKLFLIVVSLAFGLQIAAAVFTLVMYYRYRTPGTVCVFEDSSVRGVDICETWSKIPQGAVIASCVVPILIQAYICYIVAAYMKRLQKQRADRSSMVMGISTRPSYQLVTQVDEARPLTSSDKVYPYADVSNSFGSNVEYYEGKRSQV